MTVASTYACPSNYDHYSMSWPPTNLQLPPAYSSLIRDTLLGPLLPSLFSLWTTTHTLYSRKHPAKDSITSCHSFTATQSGLKLSPQAFIVPQSGLKFSPEAFITSAGNTVGIVLVFQHIILEFGDERESECFSLYIPSPSTRWTRSCETDASELSITSLPNQRRNIICHVIVTRTPARSKHKMLDCFHLDACSSTDFGVWSLLSACAVSAFTEPLVPIL